jgi:hypothetical protein
MSDVRVATRPYVIGPSATHFISVAAATTWTPASAITAFWWDASDSATVFTDAGTTLATNGQTVQQWNDKSGNSRHLSQATSTNRPTYTTGLLNSLAGVVFTNASGATTDIMNSTSFSLGQPLTIFCVYRTIATDGFAVLFGSNLASNAPNFLTKHNSFSQHSIATGAGGSVDSGIIGTDGNNFWAYITFNNTASAIQVKGGSVVTGTTGTETYTTGIWLGNTNVGNGWGGHLYEMFCIPNATGTDITNAITYMQNKWGI